MSRLNELIQELCPNGIEYKTLGDIATISSGGSFQKKDFTEYGIPCIHYGQIYTRYGLSADKTITYIDATAGERAKYAEPNDIVMAVTSENVNDVCKCVAYGFVGSGTEKKKAQAKKYEHVNKGKDEKIHFLSGLLRCPICGSGMYGGCNKN